MREKGLKFKKEREGWKDTKGSWVQGCGVLEKGIGCEKSVWVKV